MIVDDVFAKVRGNLGSDGDGEVTTIHGVVHQGNYRLEYSSFQVSGTSDPTACEVYFSIYNLVNSPELVLQTNAVLFFANVEHNNCSRIGAPFSPCDQLSSSTETTRALTR